MNNDLEKFIQLGFAIAAAVGIVMGLHFYMQQRKTGSAANQLDSYDNQAAAVEQAAAEQADISALVNQYSNNGTEVSPTTTNIVSEETTAATTTGVSSSVI